MIAIVAFPGHIHFVYCILALYASLNVLKCLFGWSVIVIFPDHIHFVYFIALCVSLYLFNRLSSKCHVLVYGLCLRHFLVTFTMCFFFKNSK